MAKRKVKEPPPKEEKKPVKKKEHLDGLDPPNHLVGRSRSEAGKPDWSGQLIEDADPEERKRWWPMVMLRSEKEEGGLTGTFIDPRYGADHWYEWADHPPTWMDPEVFADMAVDDPEVVKILTACWEKKTRKYEKLLPKHLQRVFEEKYLPYMLERFEHAKQLIGHYLTARWADGEIQKEVDEETREYERSHGKL